MAAEEPIPTPEELPTQPAESEDVSVRDYLFLGVLTLLSVMNFVDRQLLASFAAYIVPDLGLSVTQFALLTGLAFIVFYAGMGVFAGALADMLHRPRLISGALAMWSILTAASGAARGFVTLAIPRMLIGVGESVCTPTAMSMLSDRFPSSRLGMASAVYYMGVPLGVGISLLIVGYLGDRIGWRGSFYLLGAIGLVLSIIFVIFMRDPPRRAIVSGARAESPRFAEIYRTLFGCLRRSPALVLTMWGGIAMHFLFGAAAFDMLWMVEERGFDRAYIARVVGWISIPAGIAGNALGGFGSDWWQARTGQGRPLFLFWVTLLVTPVLIAYRLVEPTSVWFWTGIACLFLSLGTLYGPTMATVQELVPPHIRGTVIAFYILVVNVGGVGVGMLLGGVLIDELILREVHEPYTKGLLFMTLLGTLSLPCLYVAGRRFASDRAALERSMREV